MLTVSLQSIAPMRNERVIVVSTIHLHKFWELVFLLIYRNSNCDRLRLLFPLHANANSPNAVEEPSCMKAVGNMKGFYWPARRRAGRQNAKIARKGLTDLNE